MSERHERCDVCYYAGNAVGCRVECRRRAPTFVEVRAEHPKGRHVISAFPVMSLGDWCGDFRGREEGKADG